MLAGRSRRKGLSSPSAERLCDCWVQAIAAAGKRKNTMLAAFSVDMWSLGMLAYEIFEGYTHLPFLIVAKHFAHHIPACQYCTCISP